MRLAGWNKERRVVVLRRRIKRDVALTRGSKEGRQQVLALGWHEVQEKAQLWEYTVLVTDIDYALSAIGQIYRDRCDCENGFDELKNQWSWGGFTTQDLHRSERTARAEDFLGSEPKFSQPKADPSGATHGVAEKLVSDPNKSHKRFATTQRARSWRVKCASYF